MDYSKRMLRPIGRLGTRTRRTLVRRGPTEIVTTVSVSALIGALVFSWWFGPKSTTEILLIAITAVAAALIRELLAGLHRERELKRRISLTSSLDGVDLSNLSLGGSYLRGKSFSSAKLSGSDLRKVDLTSAILTDARLVDVDLRYAVLKKAQCGRASFYESNMQWVDLSGVYAHGASFQKADLRFANLTGAILSGAHFHDADLRGANLSGAEIAVEALGSAITDDATILPNHRTTPPVAERDGPLPDKLLLPPFWQRTPGHQDLVRVSRLAAFVSIVAVLGATLTVLSNRFGSTTEIAVEGVQQTRGTTIKFGSTNGAVEATLQRGGETKPFDFADGETQTTESPIGPAGVIDIKVRPVSPLAMAHCSIVIDDTEYIARIGQPDEEISCGFIPN